MRFYTKGSIKDGTVENGCLGLETHVEVESGESPERIRELIRMGERTCYTMQSLLNPVPIQTYAKLNGADLRLDEADY